MKKEAHRLIELSEVRKTYSSPGGDYTAIQSISLQIQEGEFVALMGPSGSGKSTLMHIMGALDTPSAGSYFFRGKNISNFSRDQLAHVRNQEIGFVFQSFNLLPRTSVLANVEKPMIYAGVPKAERVKRAMAALEIAKIADKAKNLSNHISGGQIQRVAIARAIVMEPKLILADEPTGNLDTKTADEIMGFFQDLNKEGHTIVVVTHEDDVAAFAKRIIRIRDGAVESDKPHKQRVYAHS